MNRKLTTFAIFAAAFALPAAAHADEVPPAVTASVDCSTFTVNVTGLPENTRVTVQVGAEPPYIYDGDVTTTLNVGMPEQGTTFFAAIGIDVGLTGHPEYPFQQTVDCTQTEQVAVPQMDDPEPVKAGLVASVPEKADEAVVFGNYQLVPPEG